MNGTHETERSPQRVRQLCQIRTPAATAPRLPCIESKGRQGADVSRRPIPRHQQWRHVYSAQGARSGRPKPQQKPAAWRSRIDRRGIRCSIAPRWQEQMFTFCSDMVPHRRVQRQVGYRGNQGSAYRLAQARHFERLTREPMRLTREPISAKSNWKSAPLSHP
jgi:hypothetical protein